MKNTEKKKRKVLERLIDAALYSAEFWIRRGPHYMTLAAEYPRNDPRKVETLFAWYQPHERGLNDISVKLTYEGAVALVEREWKHRTYSKNQSTYW